MENIIDKKFDNPDISIIIPVYNTQPYIKRCLDSVFKQDHDGTIEVIVLDACSTDNSYNTLKEYNAPKGLYHIIKHEKRETLSTSRVLGMRMAKGKFIMHLDSDDWLLPNSIKCILNLINTFSEVDIFVFNYIRTDSANNKYSVKLFDDDKVVEDKNSIQKYFLSTCWNKVVKRSLVADMTYGILPVTIEEDLIYSLEVLLRSNKVYLSNIEIISYYVNLDSLTRTIQPKQYLEMRSQQLEVLKELFSRYQTDVNFRFFVFNYFEKCIHLEISKTYLFKAEKLDDRKKIIDMIKQINFLPFDSIKRIERSMYSKFYCLLNLNKFFGLKYVLGSLLRSYNVI